MWKCDCDEISCLHVETCPKCLVTRTPLPGVPTEQFSDPMYLKQQIFESCMFQTVAICMGLNLQLAEILGVDRVATSKHLFKQISIGLHVHTNGVFKNIYGDMPVSESDRVVANATINAFVKQLQSIAETVKQPPPDLGIGVKEPQ